MTDDDKVGYGRPPKAFRFKKGEGGNPLGSSRKVRKQKRRLSFDDLVLKHAEKPLRLREGNRISKVSLREALLTKLSAVVLNGNRLATKACLGMIVEAEQNKRAEVVDLYEAAPDYKDNYPARAELCRNRGLPPPLPHPDDVHLNRSTGEAIITGPRRPEQFSTRTQNCFCS